jgi:hypothetical protein
MLIAQTLECSSEQREIEHLREHINNLRNSLLSCELNAPRYFQKNFKEKILVMFNQ